MKNIFKFCAVALLIFAACKSEKTEKETTQEAKTEVVSYDTFGEKITKEEALTASQMLAKFETMEVGDTLNVKFASKINDVCTKKGCWMKLPLDDSTETFVRFKDYGFFMPLNSKDREVIVEGKAFVKETSVEELQHYAEDAGKAKEEIAKITEPKREFAFEANGVLMKK